MPYVTGLDQLFPFCGLVYVSSTSRYISNVGNWDITIVCTPLQSLHVNDQNIQQKLPENDQNILHLQEYNKLPRSGTGVVCFNDTIISFREIE